MQLYNPRPLIESLRASLRSVVRLHGFMQTVCVFSGLPHSHTHALIELEAVSRRAKDLQVVLQLDKSSISRLVKRLVGKGYMQEKQDSADRREKFLVLTTKGKKLVISIHEQVNSLMEETLQQLNPTELEELHRGLERYTRAMNKVTMRKRVKVRVAEQSDDAELGRIVVRALEEHGELKPGTAGFDEETHHLSEALNGKKSRYFVAELDGEVLGGGGVGPTKGLPSDMCELKRMFIKPEARGLGIGKLLMDTCLGQAKKFGFRRCYLETLEGLVTARKFYEQEGFQYLKKPMGDTGHSACNYWMEKKF